jgi:uncharacterized protein (TIGR02599 family)
MLMKAIQREFAGFSMVEMLVSMAVLSILLLVTYGVIEGMQRSWTLTSARAEQFREARTAFEVITRNVSQAHLNTYLDYFYSGTGINVPAPGDSSAPTGYVRQSELQFVCGDSRDIVAPESPQGKYPGHAIFFQASLGQSRLYRGLTSLLNARGYFVQFLDDSDSRPGFLPAPVTSLRFRYRLMEYRPPAEHVSAGVPGNAVYVRPESWQRAALGSCSRAVADNVLMMIVIPQVPAGMVAGGGRRPWWIAPAYRYNSQDCDNSTPAMDPVVVDPSGVVHQGTRHLLPPQLRLTLVALDEDSAERWSEMTGNVTVNLRRESGADFVNPEFYEQDLEMLTDYLASSRLNYRVFTEVVTLRNASWDSKAFKNP